MPFTEDELKRIDILEELLRDLLRNFKDLQKSLEFLAEHQKKRDERHEHYIAKEVVISAGDRKSFDPVNNPAGYNRARVFLDAGFTPGHSGGLSVSLVFKNSIIKEVLALISSNGSCGKFSDPIDIAQLSGFQFAVQNRDTSNSTTVKNFRVVLYNESRA